jgi:hypothetical protein
MTPHEVPAEIVSDDQRVRFSFDAVPWLELATQRHILELHQQEWCCSRPADRVATDHPDPTKGIAKVLDYCDTISQSGDPMGYEVWVHPAAAVRWLKANRTEWSWVEELGAKV